MENSECDAFTNKELLRLLSKRYNPSAERVIITGNFERTLKIKKEDWKNYFSDFSGIGFRQGKEIEIIPHETGGSKAGIPEWIVDRLASVPGDTHCITLRNGKYYLKKLQLIERSPALPGWYIIDRFERNVVKRTYSVLLEYEKITHSSLEQMLPLVGRFRYNPLTPFQNMTGRTGFLARKEFLDGPTRNDMEAVAAYKQQLAQSQLDDGSWDENTMTTAFNLIRLVEAGVTMKEKTVEKAAQWLLSTTEPFGFPGLFMLSEKLVNRFNVWKEKQERGNSARPHRRTTDNEARKYLQDRDVLSSVSAVPCELRLTWTSGIAIEALLRCGLHEEPRVVRGINTLLTMSNGKGWCGCGYFDTREKNFVSDSLKPVDLNRFPVRNRTFDKRIIARITCDNYHLSTLDLGHGEALLVSHFRSTGECSMVVWRTLSFHPGFPGSNFEMNVASSCAGLQSPYGSWGDAYFSTAFGILARNSHPLSAFLVLRSIPLLHREQGKDGLWQESQIRNCPPPTKEESTFIILRTLKKFNFLNSLLPQ